MTSQTLPEWVTQADSAVEAASNTVRAQSRLEALVLAAEELTPFLQHLLHLRSAAELGFGTWWEGMPLDPGLTRALAEAGEALEQRKLQNAIRELRSFEERARKALLESWRKHVQTQTGDAVELENLLRALSDAPGIAEAARGLSEALGRLARLNQRLPDHDAHQIVAEVSARYQELEDRLPSEVKDFLSAAVHGGAPVSWLLKPGVYAWLLDNAALSSFKVVPGNPERGSRG